MPCDSASCKTLTTPLSQTRCCVDSATSCSATSGSCACMSFASTPGKRECFRAPKKVVRKSSLAASTWRAMFWETMRGRSPSAVLFLAVTRALPWRWTCTSVYRIKCITFKPVLSNNGDDMVDKLRFFSDYIVFSDEQLPVTCIIYGRAFFFFPNPETKLFSPCFAVN